MPFSKHWSTGRALLASSCAAMFVALVLAFWPVSNPGVQDCGSPAVFVIRNLNDVRIPGPGSVDEPANAQALRAQPRCRVLVDGSLIRSGIAFGLGIVFGLAGAIVGLVEDRRAYTREPQFESLLTERPQDMAGHGWDGPVIPAEDLGERLPELEWEEVRVVTGGSIAALVVLAWAAPLPAVRAALASPAPGWLLIAVCALVATYPLAAIQSTGVGGASAVASSFSGRLMPEYGPAGLAVHQLVRSGTPRREALASVASVQLVGLVAHAALTALALVVVFISGPVAGRPMQRGTLVALAAAALCVWGLVTARRRYRNLVVRPAAGSLASLLGADRRWLGAELAVAASLALMNGLFLVAVVRGLGGGGGWVGILAISLLGPLAVMMAPTPDGVGLVEALSALGLVAVGVDGGPAVAAVIMWRVLALWVPVLPGWIAWRRLRREGRI